MGTFYFIGGPRPGQFDEFLERLAGVGGSPKGWRIYPHASGDGRALHVVVTESPGSILDHLANFADIYDHSEIVEIRDVTQ